VMVEPGIAWHRIAPPCFAVPLHASAGIVGSGGCSGVGGVSLAGGGGASAITGAGDPAGFSATAGAEGPAHPASNPTPKSAAIIPDP
jgi:hypothetical protein